MSNQHRLPTRSFRVRPDEYDPAKAAYETAGYDINTAVRAFLSWTNTNPARAVDELRAYMDTITASAPRGRLPAAVIYAAWEDGRPHGTPDALPAGEYTEQTVTFPSSAPSPWVERTITFRLGVVDLSAESGRSAGHTLSLEGRPYRVSAAVWESLSAILEK